MPVEGAASADVLRLRLLSWMRMPRQGKAVMQLRFEVPFGKKPNAFAIGFPGLSAIGVTRGALDQWSDEELAGVLAHERTHVNQCHMLFKLAWGFYVLHACHEVANDVTLTDDQRTSQLRGLKLTGRAVNVLISYTAERLADRGARRTGHGPGLASALSKVDDRAWMHVLEMLGGNCHPRTSTRVRRLMSK